MSYLRLKLFKSHTSDSNSRLSSIMFIHKYFHPIPFMLIPEEYKSEDYLKNLLMNSSRDIHESACNPPSSAVLHSIHDLLSWSVNERIIISDSVKLTHPLLYQQFASIPCIIKSIINSTIYVIESEEDGKYLIDRVYFKKVEQSRKQTYNELS
jgi:hypothetical protein